MLKEGQSTNQNDDNEIIVKKMGIPIYNRNGNQLWPEKKSHEQIVEELEEKEAIRSD